ncbi:hypothetical protein PoB_003758300 [Plakobranchus ocellatus]|uniref:Uncharacterized protein n=1 Tax=Plakobranchus ocellatus TaxID=259542 RepID=A0AAV4AUK6_9GAST|nr:hypothetical protein PoB_003758300 [Plakobranchus ocellatus]
MTEYRQHQERYSRMTECRRHQEHTHDRVSATPRTIQSYDRVSTTLRTIHDMIEYLNDTKTTPLTEYFNELENHAWDQEIF